MVSNVIIIEDANQQTVNLAGITAGNGENQALAVTASSNNPGLIPNPTVNYTSPNPTGSLNFTSVANNNGSATITVTVLCCKKLFVHVRWIWESVILGLL